MKKSIQNGGPFDNVHFITAFVTTREIRLLIERMTLILNFVGKRVLYILCSFY
jgi:hypothetical protein